ELNGSWAFILMLIGLTIGWTIFNMPVISKHFFGAGPDGSGQGFDPYPYILYTLVLAILVALQGPLIVMSQNRQTMKDRAQAETDFRVNLKNEIGIERLLTEVGALRAESTKRLDVLERTLRNERMRAEIPTKNPGGPLTP